MLIVYMMGIYIAAILLLSLLTYFTSLRVTKVRQSFKQLALANAFAVMASVVLSAGLNLAEHQLPATLQFSLYKPLLMLALSIMIYGQCYSRHLQDISAKHIPAKLGYLIAGANFSIILIVGFGLVFALSYFKLH